MSKRILSLLFVALIMAYCTDIASGQSLSWVSWFHRGIFQSNNSVLRFNIYDTLNLACRAYGSNPRGQFVFTVTRNAVPTTAISGYGGMQINGLWGASNQIIFSDIDGIMPGFENFVVIGTNHMTNSISNSKLAYDIRYVNIGRLSYWDSATYFCSAVYITDSSPTPFVSSGALTLTVTTKPKQGYNLATERRNSYLTYTTAIISAYKFIFEGF